jgi:hypothetical protein
MAKHDSKLTAETVARNDAGLASRIASAVEQADDPAKRSAYAREQHRRSPGFKAAQAEARERLGLVREYLVRTRSSGGEISDEDAAWILEQVGEGNVPARFAATLRDTAAKMLQAAKSGNLNEPDELMRQGVIGAADTAPAMFDRPRSNDEPLSETLARIPRA